MSGGVIGRYRSALLLAAVSTVLLFVAKARTTAASEGESGGALVTALTLTAGLATGVLAVRAAWSPARARGAAATGEPLPDDVAPRARNVA